MFRCAAFASFMALFGNNIAAAQLCSGEATFQGASTRLFGTAAFGQAQTYRGGLVLGGTRVFGWAEAGMTTYQRDETGEYGAGFGVQLPGKAETKLQLCPELFLGVSSAADVGGTGVSYDETTLTFGADVGYVAFRTRTNRVVPTATLLYVMGRTKYTYANGVKSTKGMASYGLFAAGVGLGLNEHLTISPSIAVPLGLEGALPSYVIAFSFKLIGDAN
jgi:hypothetical protein